MIKTVEEICPKCIYLHYKELWKVKQALNTASTRKYLKELANPYCRACKGDGIQRTTEYI